jgi:hypothetical protein
MKDKDWTADETGRSNSSKEFLEAVAEVTRLICNHSLGDDPETTARLIVARLAHVHGMTVPPSRSRPKEE